MLGPVKKTKLKPLLFYVIDFLRYRYILKKNSIVIVNWINKMLILLFTLVSFLAFDINAVLCLIGIIKKNGFASFSNRIISKPRAQYPNG